MFFPIVLLGYHLLRRSKNVFGLKLWMVAASLVFYALGQPDFIIQFTLFGLVNYAIAVLIARAQKKPVRVLGLLLAIAWNIGVLFYYKYTNFAAEGLNLFFGTHLQKLDIKMPIGISFFTFQMLAYACDVYNREAPLTSLLDYGVFITFFPQLIVGPVVKEEEILPQIEGERLLAFDSVNVNRGIMLFSIGCAKKVLLANPLITFASSFYGGDAASANIVTTWAGVIAYTFAYYLDFSGYIDMARGIGHLFGITLPINFDSPYRARNFADFWRRWNITVTRFFSDTIFHNMFHFGDGVFKLILATLATFLVSGLWHGADWHYLVWGFANGILVCFANIMTLYRKSLPTALAVSLTFFFSVLIRVLFDCTGLIQALAIYRNMFAFVPVQTFLSGARSFVAGNLGVTAAMVLGAVVCFWPKNANGISERTKFTAGDAVWSACLLMASVFCMSQVSGFLYFNF